MNKKGNRLEENFKAKKHYWSEVEVAEYTGLAVSTLRNHRHLRKGIPYSKIFRRVVYNPDDVYEFLERHKIRYD